LLGQTFSPKRLKSLDRKNASLGCLIFALSAVFFVIAFLLFFQIFKFSDLYDVIGWPIYSLLALSLAFSFASWANLRFRPDRSELSKKLGRAGQIVLGLVAIWFIAELRINNWNTMDDPASQITAAAIRDVSDGKTYPFLSLHDNKSEDLQSLFANELPGECFAKPLKIERARYAPRIRLIASESYADAKTDDGNAHTVLLLNSGDCWTTVYGAVVVSDTEETVLSHFHVFGHAQSKEQAILQTHKLWHHVPWRVDARVYDEKRWVRRDRKKAKKDK